MWAYHITERNEIYVTDRNDTLMCHRYEFIITGLFSKGSFEKNPELWPFTILSHVWHIDKSNLRFAWVGSSQSRRLESCHPWESVMSHIGMSQFAHMSVSRRAYKWVGSFKGRRFESCHVGLFNHRAHHRALLVKCRGGIGLHCRDVGLFCGDTGLFCGNTGLMSHRALHS